jgi:hypothetical protein
MLYFHTSIGGNMATRNSGSKKVTSAKVATVAAKQLQSPSTPKTFRPGIASAVSQAGGKAKKKS